MITIKQGTFRKLVINADKIYPGDKYLMTCYSSFIGEKPHFMKIKEGYTILIDLKQTEDEILMSFKSNTRNEVRRGIKDGYFFEISSDIKEFVDFYNVFAKEKSLGLISENSLSRFGELIITKSGIGDNVLTMHANFVDRDLQKVSLLYSASVRLNENIDRKSVGISNRFLHYKELIKFKSMGLETYDFSGVCEDENNKAEYSIGQFKKGFGGKEVPYLMVYSYPFWWALKIKELL